LEREKQTHESPVPVSTGNAGAKVEKSEVKVLVLAFCCIMLPWNVLLGLLGWREKRIAEAVIHPLGIPTKYKQALKTLPSEKPVAKVMQLQAMPSTQGYRGVPGVGRRRCCSSRIGGVELLKASPENS
jgi:hypothetical protein